MPELTPITDETPLVSVIIPSYNSRPWIGKALDSLFEQTYTNLEIIVVDDGSTDDTRVYLEENYSGKINYFYQPNTGVSNARNNGLRHATGWLIQFLDADDWLLPRKIERQVTYLKQNPELGVVYSSFWSAYDDAPDKLYSPEESGYVIIPGHIITRQLKHSTTAIHSALVRRECFELVPTFSENLKGYEDWEFWLKLGAADIEFGYMDEKLVVYRLRRNSVSRTTYHQKINRFRAYGGVKAAFEPGKLHFYLNQTNNAASFEFGVARALLEQKQYKASFQQFFRSLKAKHPQRFLFTLFSVLYVNLVPFMGYYRLEKLLDWLVYFALNMKSREKIKS